MKHQQERYLETRLAVTVMMAHASLRNIMLCGHQEELRNFIRSFTDRTKGISLKVLKPEGTIVLSGDSTEEKSLYSHFNRFKRAGEEWEHQLIKDPGGEDKLVSLSRVVRLPSCMRCHPGPLGTMAYLAVETGTGDLEKEVWRSQGMILGTSLFLMMIILLSAFGFHFRFVKHSLSRITEGISRIEKGDFSVRIDMDERHELGMLAKRINRLADRLEEMRKELEESHLKEMERAERMASVGALAASIAHEIKNPISGIASAMEVLKGEVEINDERREIFDEIIRQTERVNKAVSDLLTYARPSPPELIVGNINEPIQRAVTLLEGRLNENRITLKLELDRYLPQVLLDPQKMTQVFVNLILNAIQAMPEGGMLTLRSGRVGDEIFGEVKDSGMGIPTEILDDIFKPFFTTKHQGTGLGLSICRSFIEAHNGRIEVQSAHGEGSTFRVWLKAKDNGS
ncbi:MAG: sensor histidine kinase [bacterium]